MATFFFKLIPPRPTFQADMTAEERDMMLRHVGYWTEQQNRGRVVVFGPVLDPAGGYGIGIVEADSQAEAEELRAHDPAFLTGKFREEIFLMPRAMIRKA